MGYRNTKLIKGGKGALWNLGVPFVDGNGRIEFNPRAKKY